MARHMMVLLASALLLSAASAQLMCSGILSAPNPVTSDVTVSGPGKVCTIMGVNVTGSVVVQNGGSLLTTGKVRIFGSVNANSASFVTLGGGNAPTIVSGGVVVSSTEALTISSGSNVGSVIVNSVASVSISGTTALVTTSGPGSLSISGGSINGGGLKRQNAKGNTLLCGAIITGGVSLESVIGDFKAVAGGTCSRSELSGTILVSKGEGNVNIAGGMLLGADLVVVEQNGNVLVNNAHLSDVSVTRVKGDVTLTSVVADSDGTVTGTTGNLLVKGSMFDGDFATFGNEGTVTLDSNNFGLEDISIKGNKGLVTILNNVDMSFSASENAGIIITNNKITHAMITKNSVQTSINRNSFQSLSCADNFPAPTGMGNSVITGNGQCAQF